MVYIAQYIEKIIPRIYMMISSHSTYMKGEYVCSLNVKKIISYLYDNVNYFLFLPRGI